MGEFLLCSNCFQDHGLQLDATKIGVSDETICPNCSSGNGSKLDKGLIAQLAHRFFVWGTIHRCEYGAAPVVQFNPQQKTCIHAAPWFEGDLRLIETAIGVGFFYYGPRLWMVGEVEPLKALEEPTTRKAVIDRIMADYPTVILTTDRVFYRIRKAVSMPSKFTEYDSPPADLVGFGRLDTKDFPVLYGSQDLRVCIHECRVAAEDETFVATLGPTKDLRLLDLTEVLAEEDVTEFESLDMAVHMLFLAGSHSYPISRDIARAAHAAGFDGLIYPSYFSLLRTGAIPFETTYGISHRRVARLAPFEKAKMIPNLALFGRPIEVGAVSVRCINKVILNRVEYGVHFGPVGYERPAEPS
jgi:hypothetical protein